jgi:hypothetical protein
MSQLFYFQLGGSSQIKWYFCFLISFAYMTSDLRKDSVAISLGRYCPCRISRGSVVATEAEKSQRKRWARSRYPIFLTLYKENQWFKKKKFHLQLTIVFRFEIEWLVPSLAHSRRRTRHLISYPASSPEYFSCLSSAWLWILVTHCLQRCRPIEDQVEKFETQKRRNKPGKS